MHKCINNSIGNVYHLEQFVSEFYPYSQKQLGFNQPATIRFESDEDNAGVMLGKTAYYDPATMEVALYVDGRHPKDVMRSLSHELVHHAQNCRGDFTGQDSTEAGYAQSDPHLRKMEREAYTKGNLIFRDFEDLIKTGKINIEIDFSDSGEPKMSLKEWKNNEINTKLMKKWGLLKEGSPAESENMRGRKTKEIEDVEDEKGLEEVWGHKIGPDGKRAIDGDVDSDDEEAVGSFLDPSGMMRLQYEKDPSRWERKPAPPGALGPDGAPALDGTHVWGHKPNTEKRRADFAKRVNKGAAESAANLGRLGAAGGRRKRSATPGSKNVFTTESQASGKISVREAKEITRRIIERIKKESK